MATNSDDPSSGPWEHLGRWPDLDEPTTQAANDGYQQPAALDGSMLFDDHLQDATNSFPFDLSDDAQQFSLNGAESMRTTAGASSPVFLDSQAHLNPTIRGQSDRPSSNWSSLELQMAFPNPGPCADLDFAQQNLPNHTPGSNWSGIDSFPSMPTSDTIIGSHLWVSVNDARLPGAGFGDSVLPQTVVRSNQSCPLTGPWLEGHEASNDLSPYWAALTSTRDSGYMYYNPHPSLDGPSELPFGDCFNALHPHHHVPPIPIHKPSITLRTQGFFSKDLSQIDSRDSSVHTPGSKRKKIQGGSMRGTKRKRSCRFCQLQKAQCDGKLSDTGKPCKRCHDIALNNGLAIRFCGYDLKSFDTRLGIIDFHVLDLEERWWKNIPVTCDQPTRRKVLTHPLWSTPNSVIYFPDAPTLELTCYEYYDHIDVEFLSPEDKLDVHEHLNDFMASRLAVDGKLQPGLRTTVELPVRRNSHSKSYVLQTTSLPDREKLAEWGHFQIMMRHKIDPGDVQAAYTAFLATYIETKGIKAPHADLAKMIVDLMSLEGVLHRQVVDQEQSLKSLRSIFPQEHDQNPLIPRSITFQDYIRMTAPACLPLRANSQLFAHVVALVEPLEKSILKKIDDEIEGRAKRRQWEGDPMILGFIVRCLCLHYRESTILAKQTETPKGRSAKNNQAMLDILTAHYGYIFKGTLSPFHDEWESEQHEGLLGSGEELSQLLDDVKAAEKYHYLNGLDDDCDLAYKRLVTEHETKRHSTLAKQWNKGLDPLLLAKNLENIRGQYDFELFSLNFDGQSGQSGPSAIFTPDNATKSQPSDVDESTDLPSKPHRVQSFTPGIHKPLQPTQEPPEAEGEPEPTINYHAQNRLPVRRVQATLYHISHPAIWQLDVGNLAYFVQVF